MPSGIEVFYEQAHAERTASRPPRRRTTLVAQGVWRSVLITVVTAVGLWLLAAILPGFSIDSFWDALLAGFVVGVGNAVIWPALAFLVVPLSVLTLGVGAIILNAAFVLVLLDLLPGVEIDGFWTALGIVIGLVIVTTLVSALLAIDDDASLNHAFARQAIGVRRDATRHRYAWHRVHPARRRRPSVLRRALRSGDVPTLHRWIREDNHVLVGWETGWSSQTGVASAASSTDPTADMPAFRWIDKSTGDVIVSNHPECAALIEKAHSDGNGLLTHFGSSYGNLFTGDAEHAPC